MTLDADMQTVCRECGAALPGGWAGPSCPRCLVRISVGGPGPAGVFPPGSAAVLGDYQLLDEIARGGMGVVYRARQLRLGRIVAVKILAAGEFAGGEARRRFRVEAEAAARLQHPGIVAIHDVGETDGLPWLSMDFVAGENLAALVREQPLPARQAAEYVRAIAEAVQHARTGRPLSQPLRHLEQPRAAAFTPDGTTLYTGGADGIVQRWDLRHSAEPPASASAPAPETAGVRISADGRIKLTIGERATTAVLTDVKTGAAIGAPLTHLDEITDADFSPDGALVATASNANEARVWDAATGRAISPPLRHTRTVFAVAFSPDGRCVATASLDGTARVWDARTGAPLARALTHEDHVRAARFSPDGRRIVTISRDKTARLWDAASGQPLTEPLRHDGPVQRVRFDPDGQRITTSTSDTARIWEVPDFSTPPPEWLAQLAEVISLNELPPDPAAALGLIAQYERTRAAALATTGEGAYARLARRLFAPGEAEPRKQGEGR